VQIEVHTDIEATRAELDAIDPAFRHAGVPVEADAALERRSTGALPWVISVVLGAPIATFFTTIAAEAGKDAYRPIKRWAVELLAARQGDGSTAVQDTDGTRLVLDSRLPEEALTALSDLDWSKFQQGGDIHWSKSRREWLDVFETPEAF
jgi:hypothetical protein